MKVIFVSGPYRAETISGIWENIMAARKATAMLVKATDQRAAFIVPHLNTMLMDGLQPDDYFLKADLEILKRCDAIYMLPGWRTSEGARREYEFAQASGLPVLVSIAAIAEFLAKSSGK